MFRRVLWQTRGRGNSVGEHVDLQVWLHDGHFDVEGGNLVG